MLRNVFHHLYGYDRPTANGIIANVRRRNADYTTLVAKIVDTL